jgi:hypothetical protein
MLHYSATVTTHHLNSGYNEENQALTHLRHYEAANMLEVFSLIRNEYRHSDIVAVTVTCIEPINWE